MDEDERIAKQWQQIAVEIGNQVYRSVNTADMVGTADETGYVLLFFNAKNHHGKSTLIASTTNRPELKKLLKMALRNIDGPQSTIVESGRAN